MAKNLLRKVFRPGSDVVDWIDSFYMNDTYETKCFNNDPVEIHMMEIPILQRCIDVALISIQEMINHENGCINTEYTSMYEYGEDGLKVRASKRIKSGEEILPPSTNALIAKMAR